MSSNRTAPPIAAVVALAMAVGSVGEAFAETATIVPILRKDVTTLGTAIGGWGYVPASANGGSDRFYIASVSGTASNTGNGRIRRVDVAADGTVGTPVDLVTETQWKMFMNSDNPGAGGSSTAGSLVINPVAVGSLAAYSAGFMTDGGTAIASNPGAGIDGPAMTQRIYRYDLGGVDPSSPSASARFTPLVTLKDLMTAAGTSATAGTFNRQLALSSDASRVYFAVSGNNFGGLWSVSSTGTGSGSASLTRHVSDSLASEVAIVNVGGVDRVPLLGTAASGNEGGIDYLDTASNTRKRYVSNDKLRDFLELPTSSVPNSSLIATLSFAGDADGNLYVSNTDASPERRGVYQVTPDGAIRRVISYAERNAFTQGLENDTSNANANTNRPLARRVSVTGANGAFDVTQLMYAELITDYRGIYGINVFDAGDFDRDGDTDAADLGLLKTRLTARGATASTPIADARFDLNGNGSIDWKDVKVLQDFTSLKDGDATLDFAVGYADLEAIAPHYLVGAAVKKLWTEGDFTGDEQVTYADLLLLVQNYDAAPAYPSLTVGGVFTSQFVEDYNRAIGAVPEPAAVAAIGGTLAVFARRRRQSR